MAGGFRYLRRKRKAVALVTSFNQPNDTTIGAYADAISQAFTE